MSGQGEPEAFPNGASQADVAALMDWADSHGLTADRLRAVAHFAVIVMGNRDVIRRGGSKP